MNKEFNDLNKQSYGHQEGQQSNIAGNNAGESSSGGQGGSQQTSGLRREMEAEGNEENKGPQTESDLANQNEDDGTRGGNSSI